MKRSGIREQSPRHARNQRVAAETWIPLRSIQAAAWGRRPLAGTGFTGVSPVGWGRNEAPKPPIGGWPAGSRRSQSGSSLADRRGIRGLRGRFGFRYAPSRLPAGGAGVWPAESRRSQSGSSIADRRGIRGLQRRPGFRCAPSRAPLSGFFCFGFVTNRLSAAAGGGGPTIKHPKQVGSKSGTKQVGKQVGDRRKQVGDRP